MNKVAFMINDKNSVAPLFKKRNDNTSKADYGKAVIVGGSSHYVGAPVFSSLSSGETLTAIGKAGMLVGAGTSTIILPDFLVQSVYPTLRYSSVYGMPANNGVMVYDEGIFSNLVKGKCAVALGMGVGEADMKPFIEYVLSKTGANFVVDADGLKSISGINFEGRAVITPHVGEFSRLTEYSISEIKQNAIRFAKEEALKRNCVVVLKDSVSYITDGITVYKNTNGGPSLAKGGSGDVLSGIICGLLAQGFSPLNAGRCGCYLLGRASELNPVNEYSSLPADIVGYIAEAVGELCDN